MTTCWQHPIVYQPIQFSDAGAAEKFERVGYKRECSPLFFPPLSSSPLGQFALSSPAELRRDWPKRDCSQSRKKKQWNAVQKIELIANQLCALSLLFCQQSNSITVFSPVLINQALFQNVNLYLVLPLKWYLHSSPICFPYFWLFASSSQ